MSMAFPGLTHWRECHKPLEYNEYGICKECEQKQEQEQINQKELAKEKGK